ncbi:hypothetical protein llap_5368 [Limosa lapponica baueri]|uniref:Uncharacterized protein n=1 Tax=Limosa lapponica baueri TaxID=1758121 RepID=A0A2I0UE33_LIMLA|nr:hypothetical protein llap_5368 [Limosa lapponica baueri]
MLDNPFSVEFFPNIQSQPPLAQLEAISSCPIACYLGEETLVREPKLNTVFEVQPHQCRVYKDNHFTSSAHHTIPDTGQDALDLLDHLGTLLAHIRPAVDQQSHVLFHRAALQPLFPKPVALHGVVVTQVQDLALGFDESYTIGFGPSIQELWLTGN